MSISVSDFEQLFRSNHKDLCRTANYIVNDREGAEDIVQDAFLNVWNLRNSIQPESLMGYLYRATTNGALNYLEKNKRFGRLISELKPAVQPDGSTALTEKELQASIQLALDKLPPKCRVVFVLSRFQQMRYKQIALHLGISIKTVENQMGKALEIMREELKPFLTREFLVIALSAGITAVFHFLSLLLIVMGIKMLF
jgi:RNA polymerase sigma-70 factor (ECF subfamily)